MLLRRFASLTIAFRSPTVIAGDLLGVPTAVTSDLIATCWVRRPRADRLTATTAAIESVATQIPIDGYWLQPQQPPPAITPGVTAPAILWRLAPDFALVTTTGDLIQWPTLADYLDFVDQHRSRVEHEGLFTLHPTLSSPYLLPDQLLGKRLSGVLTLNASWAEVV